MKPIFLRSLNNYDRDEASDLHGLKCEDPTLTEQSFAEECDINFIAERYGLTGTAPQLTKLPAYGDYEGIFDYQTAMNTLVAAREQFMTLPAKLRARFGNNPQTFLEWSTDDNNYDEAIKLGLLDKDRAKLRTQSNQPKGPTDETRDRGTPQKESQKPAGTPRTEGAPDAADTTKGTG